jgi:hypothetical protein
MVDAGGEVCIGVCIASRNGATDALLKEVVLELDNDGSQQGAGHSQDGHARDDDPLAGKRPVERALRARGRGRGTGCTSNTTGHNDETGSATNKWPGRRSRSKHRRACVVDEKWGALLED